MPAPPPLPPPQLRLRLDPGVRRRAGGRVLVGGSPLRVVRLNTAGAAVVDDLAGGAPAGPGLARRRLARRLLDGGLAHPLVAMADADGATVEAAGPDRLGPADVTAVVPVRGHADALDRTLSALAADRAAGMDVIVVDDGSPPPAAAAVASVAAARGAQLRRRPVNGGPAAARNTGLTLTRRPVVVFLDADTSPTPGWLAPLLAHLADPAVVAVAPRVRPRLEGPAGTAPRRRRGGGRRERFERRHSPLDMGPAAARVAPRSRVTYVPTAALLARRQALEAVGGFAEELRYGEDVDLVWRLVAAGGTVRYEPAAVVEHAVRTTWPAWLAQRAAYGTAAAPLARRHPGQVPPLAASAWSVVAWGSVVAGYPAVGVGVAVASAAMLGRKLRRVLPRPAGEALRLAAWGHGQAGRWMARAVTRSWWPLALVGALASRRLRRAVLAAALVPAVADWRPGDGLGPLSHIGLRLGDDVAYGAGVWWGCWRHRTVAPLVPVVRGGRLGGADADPKPSA